MPALFQSNIPGIPCRRGKVRDVYDLGDRLVLVATDRISAFDCVLPTCIPDKGRVLTSLTLFWLDYLGVPNHLIGIDLAAMGPEFSAHAGDLAGRSCLVKKTRVVPIECVVRGFLGCAGCNDYRAIGSFCCIRLPPGLRHDVKLTEPILTQASKEESGHDQNISLTRMSELVGADLAEELRSRSIDIYRRASSCAESRGILLADTKFEWGLLPNDHIILIDEVLTPDSSRFWPADEYRVGANPPSFDKQFVRDWLESTPWDKIGPAPELPQEVVLRTGAKYLEAHERLTGKRLE